MGLGSSMCNICGNIVESTLHDCPLVMLIWLNSIHIIARNEFFDGDLKHRINVNMNIRTDLYANVEWRCFWATACQQIWYRRNMEHHDKRYVRPVHLVQEILKRNKEYIYQLIL
jgi:hypothetical protein